MEIIHSKNEEYCQLSELKPGDCFIHQDSIGNFLVGIKVSNVYNAMKQVQNVFYPQDGECDYLSSYRIVKKLPNARLIVDYKGE